MEENHNFAKVKKSCQGCLLTWQSATRNRTDPKESDNIIQYLMYYYTCRTQKKRDFNEDETQRVERLKLLLLTRYPFVQLQCQ